MNTGAKRNSRRDTVLLRNALLAIDVDFHEHYPAGLMFRSCEVSEDRRNCLAGPAPVSVEVYDDICRGR